MARVLSPGLRAPAARAAALSTALAVGRARMTRAEMPGHHCRPSGLRLLVETPRRDVIRAEAVLMLRHLHPGRPGRGEAGARRARRAERLIRHLGSPEEPPRFVAGREVRDRPRPLRGQRDRPPRERLAGPARHWAVRTLNRRPCLEVANDPLTERRSVVARANDLRPSRRRFWHGAKSERQAIEASARRLAVALTGGRRAGTTRWWAHRHRPDLSFLSELASRSRR